MPVLKIPASHYSQNHLRQLARQLRGITDELEGIDKRTYNREAPPDDSVMDLNEAEIKIIANAVSNLGPSLQGWWNQAKHEFMLENP